MRKLTDKIKYAFDNDSGAILYAVNKETGKYQPFGLCHIATLNIIKDSGIRYAIENGLVNMQPAQ